MTRHRAALAASAAVLLWTLAQAAVHAEGLGAHPARVLGAHVDVPALGAVALVTGIALAVSSLPGYAAARAPERLALEETRAARDR